MIEVVVESIRVSLVNYQRVVILHEKQGSRYLPIWIGSGEADAIAIKLQNVAVSRPLTHDLFNDALQRLGVTVTRVEVTALEDDVFYAVVHLNQGERTVSIDSRPSDAIALAVRCGAPVFVAEQVMDRAGIQSEEEGPQNEAPASDTASDEERAKLNVYRDFIESLDLDQLDPP